MFCDTGKGLCLPAAPLRTELPYPEVVQPDCARGRDICGAAHVPALWRRVGPHSTQPAPRQLRPRRGSDGHFANKFPARNRNHLPSTCTAGTQSHLHIMRVVKPSWLSHSGTGRSRVLSAQCDRGLAPPMALTLCLGFSQASRRTSRSTASTSPRMAQGLRRPAAVRVQHPEYACRANVGKTKYEVG